MDGWLGRV